MQGRNPNAGTVYLMWRGLYRVGTLMQGLPWALAGRLTLNYQYPGVFRHLFNHLKALLGHLD